MATGDVDVRELLPKRLSRTDVTTGAGSLEEQIDSMFGDALNESNEVVYHEIMY